MNNTRNDIEKLRQSFRPEDIKALFVGESAPAGDTFFYRGNSQMFRYMKKKENSSQMKNLEAIL